jgi:hypothetical protein
MTDGKFDGVSNEQLRTEIARYLDEGNRGSSSKLQVAFLSIGDEAPVLAGLEGDDRFIPAKAATPEALIEQMNIFANTIFRQRSAQLDSSGSLVTDIDMTKIDVFAQGPTVNVESLLSDGGAITESDSVEIKWSDNPMVVRADLPYEAIPETRLQGQLVTFKDVPKGELSFDIKDVSTPPYIFKTPEVGIGIDLLQNGATAGPKFKAGKFEVEPFVVDKNCEKIESTELGNPQEPLVVSFKQGDEILGPFTSGQSVDLAKGDYEVRMAGYFPDNLSIESVSALSVESAVSSGIRAIDSGEYKVSELAEFPPESAGTQFEYVIIEDGVERSFTQAEWDQIPPEELKVESGNSNIEFEAIKGSAVGEVTVVPRAPGGDVFAADTGAIEFEVSSEYTAGGEITSGTSAQGSIEVVDDLSAFDRFMNWWKTVGWKLLLLLLLLLLILGYIFKRRFSKHVRKRPQIQGIPNQVGTRPADDFGKFQKSRARALLPFVADTATLKYVPSGVSGFRVMKLKAGPGKTMIVTNWRQITENGNTEINGTTLDSETRRGPVFGPSASITATTPQMTYEMTPNA